MNNREIDAIIGEKIMGWGVSHSGAYFIEDDSETTHQFRPTESISDAWIVVDKITNNPEQQFRLTYQINKKWVAVFYSSEEMGLAPTAPLAICHAALKSVGVDTSKYTHSGSHKQ